MRIRSWHIAASGLLIQVLAGFILIGFGKLGFAGLFLAIAGIFHLLLSLAGLVPTALLYFGKSTSGGILSLFLGIIGILAQALFLGFSMIGAGILALLKERRAR